jgi:1-deoxy-D-xylulose-5-phosphate synthase
VHDICIQKLPVVLCIDRAGLVGNDGETHHGVFDISYLSHIPNLMILSPKDATELEFMLTFAAAYNDGPIAIRYPRGNAERFDLNTDVPMSLEPELLKSGEKTLLIATGKMVKTAIEAAELLPEHKIGVVNLRKIKPLDEAVLIELMAAYDHIVTLEDHMIAGGMGESVSRMMHKHKIFKHITHLGIDDAFVEQGDMDTLLKSLNLHAQGVAQTLSEVLNG